MKKFFILLIGLLALTVSPAFAAGDTELKLRPVCAAGGDKCVQQGATEDQSMEGFKKDQDIVIEVVIKNPEKQNIISVRTWLKYDPARLEGVAIDAKDSPFSLVAPGEDGFDPAEGQVKLGRANISGGVNADEIKVAMVRFKVKTAEAITSKIGFYDYQVSELGHTGVNIIESGFPVNVLAAAPKSLVIKLNGGGAGSGGSAVIPVAPPAPTPEPLLPPPPAQDLGGIGGSNDLVPMANLARPSSVKLGTSDGMAILSWDRSAEKDLKGYHIYYGKVSGAYTRRRDVGKVGKGQIEGLTNGETYYFALTAYDGQNRESDYSDEVAVIIGQPLSSTAPMGSKLARVPSQPQNGPLVGWLLFSAAGLSGTLLFRKKPS